MSGPCTGALSLVQSAPQISTVDLSVRPREVPSLWQLSDAHDLQWAGVHVLPARATLHLPTPIRHDIYIIYGELLEERGAHHHEGGFFSRSGTQTLQAGTMGAVFFLYRDRTNRRSGLETWHHDELVWHAGRTAGMRVANLSRTHHQVSLVAWQAGTQTRAHDHAHGEEIFVLQGALCDERGAFPAGSWLRFRPGCVHTPYAEVHTLILLRHGHLLTTR